MNKAHHYIDSSHWTLAEVDRIIRSGKPLKLADDTIQKISRCREYLDGYMSRDADPVYGVNTGFGSLCNTVIENDELSLLQENLVKSHACGAGKALHRDLVKLMILLKVKGLSHGHSGVQVATVQRLVDMYNHEALPIVYEQGSLGASGDLAPLAHLSLPLLGLGEVEYKGKQMSGAEYLKEEGLSPLTLRSKEGLALLNGTQFMSALGVWSWLRSWQWLEGANLIAAMSLDAYQGLAQSFNHLVHEVRPHPGQQHVAKSILHFLEGSEILKTPKAHVQDPYSFRCIPQVHGATYDALKYVEQVFEREINSVTDNPTIFPEEDLIISAGNFHGQPLALALDHMAIAMAEIGSISERRTYKLVGGTRDLPAFLVNNPGLNSGFMIPQYTSASIVSKNKQLCTPSSVDTIDSSNGQEDHVSMGANGAVRTMEVVRNVAQVLGIELFNAAQALDFRRPLKSSPAIEKLHQEFRERVPFVEEDPVMYPLMREALCFVYELRATDY